MKNFPTSGEKIPAGLLKLHSTCPKEHFTEKYIFWRNLLFQSFSSKLFVKFRQKPSTGLSKLHSTSPGEHFKVFNFFQTWTRFEWVIPSIWKTARIIPFLKPGKPDDTGKSYRPVSLLSPLVKALETLLLPTLTEHLPVVAHQHGFRKARSTTTALYEIDCHITRGLNKRKSIDRTVLVALDLRAAFDTVNINKLPNIILASKIPKYTKRWLCSYLRGRQTYVEFRNAKSTFHKVRARRCAVTHPVQRLHVWTANTTWRHQTHIVRGRLHVIRVRA